MKDENKDMEDFKNENKEPEVIKKLEKSLYLNNIQKGILDSLQEKLASRKLLVFLTATGLFVGAGLDPETWGMIAMIYIGGQSAIDIVQTWRHGRQ
jgi:hypothetical protein